MKNILFLDRNTIGQDGIMYSYNVYQEYMHTFFSSSYLLHFVQCTNKTGLSLYLCLTQLSAV